MLGSEWDNYVRALVSQMSDLNIFHPCVSLPPLLDSQFSTLIHHLPLNHQCKIPANKSHSFLPPQPPAFPFPLTYSLFSFVLWETMIYTYLQPHRISSLISSIPSPHFILS